MSLVDGVRRVKYSAGQRVQKKGDALATFFMVDSGKVRELPEGVERSSGDFFGELALLGGHSVDADVISVNASVLLAVDVETFERVLGPYLTLLEAHYNCAVLAQVGGGVCF
jgi:CRP-like cAMP-binding protein